MDKDNQVKFGMATLLGKLYETFEIEVAILDIQVTEVTKVICRLPDLVYIIGPELLPNSMKLGEIPPEISEELCRF